MNYKSIHIFRSFAALLICTAVMALAACHNEPQEPETPQGFSTLEDLDGHRVGVVAGSTSDMMLSDTNNFPNVQITRFNSPNELFEAIKNDSVHCGITDTAMLLGLDLEKSGMGVDFNLAGGYDVAAAFNMNQAKLRDKFNDFLVQIKSDGTFDTMLNRWCSGRTDTTYMPDMPELAKLKGRPLEVATVEGNAPFSLYRHNHWTGLEVEMMMRFSLFINRPIHFSSYRFDEVIPALRAGKVDAAAATLFITPDRADIILFSNPYYFCKTSCISKRR